MLKIWSTRWQAIVVGMLFLGSLAALLVNTFATLALPQRELQARHDLREAGRRMADRASPIIAAMSAGDIDRQPHWDKQLRDVANEILVDYPGVEGGFYVIQAGGIFGAYAFPTSPHKPEAKSERREPPPLETPYIRLQAQESLTLQAGESLTNIRDVGPSRVMFLTEPVGAGRPALAAAWVMFRLVDPGQLGILVHRYQFSTVLALGGLGLSVLLMLNLGRTLRRQRLVYENLRAELRRSEHLAALGKLLAGVAHEIRNPLAGIRSTIQLWQRFPEKSQTTGSMEAVIQATDRLSDIVARLLYFSRSDSTERQAVNVNDVLIETFQLLGAQAEKQGVSMELDLAADMPLVLASPSGLRQVFLNLATNALQAMPHGGRLHCVSQVSEQDHGVEILLSDTGGGISREVRAHLFEPFFTTRPEGTGLGLAICREIILQHNGVIELLDKDGAVAVFRVTLPAKP
jgi:two-component system, NtrC family, sensor histidine kinase HydH